MNNTFSYKTKGTCASMIELETDENNRIVDVRFKGGCNGNLKGISVLIKGMDCAEAADKLSGIRCGMKSTSCPDQLSVAIRQMLQEQKQ